LGGRGELIAEDTEGEEENSPQRTQRTQRRDRRRFTAEDECGASRVGGMKPAKENTKQVERMSRLGESPLALRGSRAHTGGDTPPPPRARPRFFLSVSVSHFGADASVSVPIDSVRRSL